MKTVWDIIKSPVITEKALVAKKSRRTQGSCSVFRLIAKLPSRRSSQRLRQSSR